MKTLALPLLLVGLVLSACSDEVSSVGPECCRGVVCSGHGDCVLGAAGAMCECYPCYHAEGLSCVEDAVDAWFWVSCSGHEPCLSGDRDEAYEIGVVERVEPLCACRERTRVDFSLCTVARRCKIAADCCPDAGKIDPLVCNVDDPYRYACKAGVCEKLSCVTDDHCVANFSVVQKNKPGHWVNEGCVAAECSASDWRCSYRETCKSAADCCPLADSIAPHVCQVDYPYVYECEEGFCRMVLCTHDAQCKRSAERRDPADGWVHMGCVDKIDPCTDRRLQGKCTFKKTCKTYQDCCPEDNGSYTCGVDSPYRYECINKLCEHQRCSADAQCEVFFERWYGDNLDNYIDLGCVKR
ncbi:MAG: hypothetical protein JRF33_14695 [Deltaproteobacteria bacterium]|nr:hypothetical protein [Deltaproteobacteria bacterium]